MNTKRFLTLLLVVVLMLTVVACGKKEEAAEGGKNLKNAGVLIYRYDDNFMSFVRLGLDKYAKDNLNIDIVDSQNDQAKQNEQVDTFLSKGVDVLVVNAVNQQAAGAINDKAKEKNVPIVYFNREPEAAALEAYDKAYYVGTVSAESGIMQGKMIADAWKANKEWDKNGDGVIQYVLLKGEPGHPDAEARTEHVIKEIEAAGLKVQELELQAANWEGPKAKDIMDSWISKHKDGIELVIANNDGMALGALTSLEAAGYFGEDNKFMPIAGVDALPDALQKIEEGKMIGSILNDAGGQAKATIEMATNLANGKEPLEGLEWKFDGDSKVVRVPYKIITKDNVDDARKSYGEQE